MTKAERKLRYPLGCRVVATAKFREQFKLPPGRAYTGTVVGYGRNEDHVRVLRDGNRSRVTYHWHFWDPIV